MKYRSATSEGLVTPTPSWQRQAAASAAREILVSRMLMAYVISGMVFMLLPGTFLGVWNLLSISSRHAPDSLSPGWIQAHGHAQIFGWIGTFIIGIGFYSIPKLRKAAPAGIINPWICLVLWAGGVGMRWAVGTYEFHWRLLLPLSAIFELVAFLIFFTAVSGHRPSAQSNDQQSASQGTKNAAQAGLSAATKRGRNLQQHAWIIVVLAGTVGFLLALVLNLVESANLSFTGTSPAFPRDFDARFLAVCTWGFLVPFVWGFTSRWMPAFLGLKASQPRLLFAALFLNTAGVAFSMFGKPAISALLLLCGASLSVVALRLFGQTTHSPRTRGISGAFPAFAKIAYIWLPAAAILSLWGSLAQQSLGIAGASRHALTVGFIVTMVFCVGPRILPAFSGMRVLFSARLMSAALVILSVGCAIHVSSEIIAYQGYAEWAWGLLPVSAIIEMTAITLFAVNLAVTFLRRPLVQASGAVAPTL